MKNVFTSYKRSFQSQDNQNFCNFFPSYPHFPDTKEQRRGEQVTMS